jgi:hypothetical protein
VIGVRGAKRRQFPRRLLGVAFVAQPAWASSGSGGSPSSPARSEARVSGLLVRQWSTSRLRAIRYSQVVNFAVGAYVARARITFIHTSWNISSAVPALPQWRSR